MKVKFAALGAVLVLSSIFIPSCSSAEQTACGSDAAISADTTDSSLLTPEQMKEDLDYITQKLGDVHPTINDGFSKE